MKKDKFNVIVDSAWGSSGKGAASTRLADLFNIENVSSCNYANAGHTTVINNNNYVFKFLPTASILKIVGKNIKSWIGPNSGAFRDVINKEISLIGGDSIIIHNRSVYMDERHIKAELGNGKQSVERISSTMSGSGAAFAEKLMRQKEVETISDIGIDPVEFYTGIRNELQNGKSFLHEVSQGFALSVNSGTHYPQCTFRECTPQQAYADMGITPSLVGDVYLNVRSYPIRVGNNYDLNGKMIGYSGDVNGDSKELSWSEICDRAEMPDYMKTKILELEKTTVTKKIRRVFEPSWELLKYSSMFCGATKLVLNFPQYIHWSAYGVRGGRKEFLSLHSNIRNYIDKMESETNLPVVMIGTSEKHEDFILPYEGV